MKKLKVFIVLTLAVVSSFILVACSDAINDVPFMDNFNIETISSKKEQEFIVFGNWIATYKVSIRNNKNQTLAATITFNAYGGGKFIKQDIQHYTFLAYETHVFTVTMNCGSKEPTQMNCSIVQRTN